jgi:hypothetical protein
MIAGTSARSRIRASRGPVNRRVAGGSTAGGAVVVVLMPPPPFGRRDKSLAG